MDNQQRARAVAIAAVMQRELMGSPAVPGDTLSAGMTCEYREDGSYCLFDEGHTFRGQKSLERNFAEDVRARLLQDDAVFAVLNPRELAKRTAGATSPLSESGDDGLVSPAECDKQQQKPA